jgi:peptide deformylase
MSVLEILRFPNSILRKKAKEVEAIDERIHNLAHEMMRSLYCEPGIGLAAPQVGVSVRLIVVDLSIGEDPDSLIVLLNPEIIVKEGTIKMDEGCLSVPDINEAVTRAERVVVKGHDLEGRAVEVEGEELLAVALQHEIDHLDGILFIDHISRLKRSRYITKRKKELAAEKEGR